MALVTFNDNVQLNAPKHIDTRYINLFTPWASTAAANAAIPTAYRYLGLTVLIGITEYWYQSSTADGGLIPKIGGVTAITANNGVNMSTSTNVQLGGAIIQNTLLDTTGGDFKIYINGSSNTVSPFIVTNALNAPAILGQATSGSGGVAIKGVTGTGGIALYGQATNGIGVYGTVTVTAGVGLYSLATASGSIGASINATGGAQPLYSSSDSLPSYFNIAASSTNTVLPVVQLVRQTQSNGANNIGGSIEFYLQKTASGIALSNQIISEYLVATNGTQTSQLRFTGVNSGSTVDKMYINSSGTLIIASRFQEASGASVASANNLVLGTDGNLFHITGTTQINALTIANWQAGSRVTLIFNASVTVKHNTAGGGGTAPFILAGATDFAANAGDTLTIAYDGSSWYELTRKTTVSGGVYTFRNGLTESPATFVGLGGTLINNTSINNNGFFMSMTGNTAANVLTLTNVTASTNSPVLVVTTQGSSNQGIAASTDAGTAISGIASTSGLGGSFVSATGSGLFASTQAASTSTVANILTLQRDSTGGAGANGIGGAITYTIKASDSSFQTSNLIYSKWINATVGTRTSQLTFQGVNSGTTVDKLYIGGNSTQVISTRFEYAMGATVASANNLTLGNDGNFFVISGTTQINAITTADWQAGSTFQFYFQSASLVVKNNTAGGGGTAVIFLAGGVDYTSSVGDILSFLYDGTAFRETSRSKIAALGGYTFTNGLTESPVGTVKLGGTLSGTTFLNTGGNILVIQGSTGSQYLLITNSNTAGSGSPVLQVQSGGGYAAGAFSCTTGTALQGTTGTGVGILGTATGAGIGGYFLTLDPGATPVVVIPSPTSINTVVTGINITRSSNGGGTPANGIGVSIDYNLRASDSTFYLANQFISQWTNATAGNRTSSLTITGTNNAVNANLFTLSGSGQLQLNKYGAGTFTGTAAKTLQVDSSGNIIEGSPLVGITANNGITITGSNVALGGSNPLVGNTTINTSTFNLSLSGSYNGTVDGLLDLVSSSVSLNTPRHAIWANNSSAATTGNAQYGPAYISQGSLFNGGLSQSFSYRWYTKPASTYIGGALVFESSWNTNAYQSAGQIESFPSGAPGGTAHFGGGNFGVLQLGYTEFTSSNSISGYYANSTSGTFALTHVPAAASAGSFGGAGTTYTVFNSGTGVMTLTRVGADVFSYGGSSSTTISLAQGQFVTIVSDGVSKWYVLDGGTMGGLGANNGITINTGIIQLGGTLNQNTTINHASTYQLSFTNAPIISIGTSSAQTDRVFNVTDTSSSLNYLAFFNKTMALSNSTNVITTENFLQATGSTFTGTMVGSHTDAAEGQLWMNYSGAVALEPSVSTSYSGVYGAVIRAGTGSYTGNVMAGGYFGGYAASSGNADNVAGIIVQGLQSCPPAFGASYTGTVTNYYGILVNNVGTSTLSGSVTNKYGIYIKGTAGAGVSNVAESAFTTPSDRRIKENIKISDYGLKEIEQLNTTEFTYIDDIAGSGKEIGFIAQDVESILPEAVRTKDLNGITDFRLLDKDVIFSVLVNAVKELSSQNKILFNQVNELLSKN